MCVTKSTIGTINNAANTSPFSTTICSRSMPANFGGLVSTNIFPVYFPIAPLSAFRKPETVSSPHSVSVQPSLALINRSKVSFRRRLRRVYITDTGNVIKTVSFMEPPISWVSWVSRVSRVSRVTGIAGLPGLTPSSGSMPAARRSRSAALICLGWYPPTPTNVPGIPCNPPGPVVHPTLKLASGQYFRQASKNSTGLNFGIPPPGPCQMSAFTQIGISFPTPTADKTFKTGITAAGSLKSSLIPTRFPPLALCSRII
mmetsp:Transcript_8981/g.15400  ORF Transcript_8981/g.15400 Transcript_8981/m.15400 type:complete len:258 (-) Transcript_8981:701-1474(-)